jgi:hypothetical protein
MRTALAGHDLGGAHDMPCDPRPLQHPGSALGVGQRSAYDEIINHENRPFLSLMFSIMAMRERQKGYAPLKAFYALRET